MWACAKDDFSDEDVDAPCDEGREKEEEEVAAIVE